MKLFSVILDELKAFEGSNPTVIKFITEPATNEVPGGRLPKKASHIGEGFTTHPVF